MVCCLPKYYCGCYLFWLLSKPCQPVQIWFHNCLLLEDLHRESPRLAAPRKCYASVSWNIIAAKDGCQMLRLIWRNDVRPILLVHANATFCTPEVDHMLLVPKLINIEGVLQFLSWLMFCWTQGLILCFCKNSRESRAYVKLRTKCNINLWFFNSVNVYHTSRFPNRLK